MLALVRTSNKPSELFRYFLNRGPHGDSDERAQAQSLGLGFGLNDASATPWLLRINDWY